jgi:16S rRNA (guanine966-N2)-methyltransferase
MKKELTTTVLAGTLKGKKLQLPSLETTRSSKQILKGSVFDRLQFDIIDSTFVEVFAGSGSVGIEAVSRGAKMVYFIEKDDHAYNTLKSNLKSCSITNYDAYHDNSFERFSSVLDRIDEPAYFYFDPPFSLRDGYDDVYDKVIEMISSIDRDKVIEVIIEYQTGIDLPETIGALTLAKKRKFGKSSLNFYTL